jgi:hypothetical protein
MSRNPIDRAHHLLRLLGWSFGNMSHWQDGRQAWQVYAHRDHHRIVVNAWTQCGAWDEALRQAGTVQRG